MRIAQTHSDAWKNTEQNSWTQKNRTYLDGRQGKYKSTSVCASHTQGSSDCMCILVTLSPMLLVIYFKSRYTKVAVSANLLRKTQSNTRKHIFLHPHSLTLLKSQHCNVMCAIDHTNGMIWFFFADMAWTAPWNRNHILART